MQSVLAQVDFHCPVQGEWFSHHHSPVVCELAAWFTCVPSAALPARPGLDTNPSSQQAIILTPIANLSPYLNK